MEQNRQRALQIRAAKQQQQKIDSPSIVPTVFAGFSPEVNPNPNPRPAFTKIVTGECRLISRSRFTVDIEYHKEVIDAFKTVPRCVYDSKDRKWNFPVEEHAALLKAIKPLRAEVRVTPLPEFIVKVFKTATPQREIPNVDLSSIDQTLTDDLYPFQHEGVCFGIWKQGRILLADDMGLGKTIQAIAICAYYRDEWPLLIVAPSSVRYAWQQSLLRWMPSIDPQSITVVNTGKDEICSPSVLIVSYEMVSKKCDLLKSMAFRVVIVDESHFMKSHTAARTRAVMSILKKAKRVCLLSGTPALSRPSELFTQVSSVCPKIFPSFMDFGLRYCDAKMTQFGYDYTGATNMGELKLLLEETIMIRRLKSDVLDQLPAKRREMVLLDPTAVDSKSRVMKALASKAGDASLQGLQKRGALLEYYCQTGYSKIEAIKIYLCDLLQTDKKFLCFAHHKIVIDEICGLLIEKKYKYIRIDGKTNSYEKNRLCESFQSNDSYRVAVLSITAANMGITLTAAHLVIFAELFWNPGILTQAEDRAHRIGQEDSVLVQYLVAKNTADDYMWPLVSKKLDVLNRAGLSKDNFRNADMNLTNSKSNQKNGDIIVSEEVLKLLESVGEDDNAMDALPIQRKKVKK